VVPVRPGRNMSTIVEVAARNHLLKLQGHHSARDFADRLTRAIEDGHKGPQSQHTLETEEGDVE
jgi:HPr kinase/phosphorylase